MLISTPYMQSGILYEKHKQFFGVESPDVLVWAAPTILMNPSVSEDRLARELRVGDPLRYKREYEAMFVEPLTVFLSSAWVDAAVQAGVHELPHASGAKHVAALDPSGGGQDAMTLAIVRAEGQGAERRVTQVVMRAWAKPKHESVDLEGAVSEAAAICGRYNLAKIYCDRFTAQWVQQAFRRHGIEYAFPTARTRDGSEQYLDRSAIYLEAESLFAQGRVRILDHPALVRELKNLERRPSQGGRDRVDHPRGQHDDHANALCLAAVMARGGSGLPRPMAFALDAGPGASSGGVSADTGYGGRVGEQAAWVMRQSARDPWRR